MRGKWTPGPWKVECGDHTHRFVLVTDSDDRTIYYKYGAGTAKAADQDEADAHLIAAAPALYEALEAIVTAADRERRYIGGHPGYDDARAALSLAHPPANHTEESKP